MKFPESWLRSFCNPEWSTEQLAERLTMAGLEVEEVTPAAPPFSGVVVGHVLSVTRHPNADKLNVCEVDTGSGVQSIVCGAPNVAPGVRVPCALPGAVLPGGFAIRPVTMRGVDSNGMLCSARELGLSEDHGGLLLLPADAPVGADIRKYLQLEDQVFLLKLTPNLAHCFGVQGIAREVAALSGAALSVPSFAPVAVTLAEKLPVSIEAPDLCGRFSGRVIRGVDARAATPDWMKRRLERAGQRPISALVDISNYVMLELGRPSHIFDLHKIAGGLQVRWGRDGEQLELLNGQVIELDPQVGVIADASGQVESLAGIMGGASTAVSLDTTAIYVEAAFWWPAAIAGRARRYNFSTDAAQRFERGVDPASTVDHLEYLSRLILEICGGQAAPVDDTITGLPERKPVSMRIARARKVIGIEISEAEIAQAFQRLQLPARREGDHFVVTPPSYRFDLQIEEDLIEEVVRLWGYERLPVRPPRASLPMLAQPEARRSRFAVRRAIAARDYQEVIGYSFVGSELDRMLGTHEPIRLLNPIAAQMDVMRTTLWGGLIETLRANLNRRATRVRLFEAGRVFAADPSVQPGPLAVNGVRQPEMLGGIAYGPAADEQWGMPARAVDFFDVKADVLALFGSLAPRWERAEHPALHPGRSARLTLDGRPVGWLGTLHPAVQQALELPQAPVLFEVEMDALVSRPVPSFEPVSKFPPVVRDLALVVDQSIPAQRLLDEVEAARVECASGGLLRNVILFDEYRGKGLENKEKSLAIRLWMQDTQRTLNDAEVNDLIAAIVDRVGRSLGARLRSGA
ncbi:phenylalanine--tRNA ligase subunit beta [Quisquiliibacterium transsilvanicum]|jgi:phenylalanyl-tRNA synthetase beta chain|uniref:Phenylalanine--tRNA ligase beta subunit n=1 Tax=Quisquiliibacterium transsilvanicum TaxID=1549638 RepID=A0A7W8HFQ5_9BURK|nr:phenylalanine--tRNA ligase subunit beta [Quisquiliibacterium transsilvanicum]MBB5270621.1 phenylalanyl-tRNA synthetase beta chain [Quisquiliibacterium transsilvanicum]